MLCYFPVCPVILIMRKEFSLISPIILKEGDGMKILFYRKQNSNDYMVVTERSMILHEFECGEDTYETLSVLTINDGGEERYHDTYDMIGGKWFKEEDQQTYQRMLEWLRSNECIKEEYEKGVRI